MDLNIMTPNKRFRIKKPHQKYIDKMMYDDITHINGDRVAGLYISRLAKQNKELFNIKPESHDNWVLYQKKPIKKKLEGVKYTWYGL